MTDLDSPIKDNNLQTEVAYYQPEAHNLQEVLAIMEQKGITRLIVDDYDAIMNKYKLDLDALAHSTVIEDIGISINDVKSIDFLYTLPNLKRLSLVGWDETGSLHIDYTAFPFLEFLLTEFPNESLGACHRLKMLKCYKSKKIKNLHWLQHLTQLEEFKLCQAKIKDLQGIENCTQLKRITLGDCSNLTTLAPLGACTALQKIWLEKIKSLDISALATCSQLEDFYAYGVKTIPSITPLAQLPHLKGVSLLGKTCVTDGNLAVLKDQLVERFAFDDYPHYNLQYVHKGK